jgi:hypothetical protein
MITMSVIIIIISYHRFPFPWYTAPLMLQVSHCSTFLIMCYVLSAAVVCTESIECFPHIVSRYSYFF